MGPLPLPREHGSWILFAGPAVLGPLLAGAIHPATILAWVSGLALFLLREPLRTRARTPWVPTLAALSGLAAVPLLVRWPLALIGLPVVAAGFTCERVGGPRLASNPWWQLAGTAALALMAPATFLASGGTAAEVGPGAAVGAGVAAGDLTSGVFVQLSGLWALATAGFGLGVLHVQVLVKWVRLSESELTPWVRLATAWWFPLAAAGGTALVWWMGRAGGTPPTGSMVPAGVWPALLPGVARSLWTVAFERRQTRFKRVGQLETAFAVLFIALAKLLWRF